MPIPPAVLRIADRVDAVYGAIDRRSVRVGLERLFVASAAVGFLAHLGVIALSRNSPEVAEALFGGLDRNYLHAVYTPFSFILFFEVLLLVLALPRSHTTSIEKQYQIVSLIVIRRVFKDLGGFSDLETWVDQQDAAWAVLYDMLGAAAMFLLVTAFARVRRMQEDAAPPPAAKSADLRLFVSLKRATAMLLGVLLIGLAVVNVGRWLMHALVDPSAAGHAGDAAHLELDTYFFPAFFEAMIFTDVFLLIISIAFYDQYQYVFRNAGFVISTVLVRVALSSPRPYDLALALLAMVYGITILAIFQWFDRSDQRSEVDDVDDPVETQGDGSAMASERAAGPRIA